MLIKGFRLITLDLFCSHTIKDRKRQDIKYFILPYSALNKGCFLLFKEQMLFNCHFSQSTFLLKICKFISVHVLSLQACSTFPTLYSLMDCSPPGSSFHGILQARILEWVAVLSFRGFFPTQVSNPCLLWLLHCRQILYHRATREAFI